MPVSSPARNVTPENVRRIAQTLPSSARIFARLQALLQRAGTDLTDIVDLVRVDAALAAGVVRLSNSAQFCRGEPVESVHEAINRVGIREVNRIVGMTVSSQLFSSRLPLYRLDGEELSQNSLATALAMGFLAKAAHEDERLGYTLGLLRSVGLLALQRWALMIDEPLPPSTFDPTNKSAMESWEREHFGVTHGEMSVLLLKEWGFDPTLCAAVKNHRAPRALETGGAMAAILHVACSAVETLGKSLAVEKAAWSVDGPLLKQAGLREKDTQACVFETRSELNRLGALVRVSA